MLLVHSGVAKKWRCVVAASDSSRTRGEPNPRLGFWNYTFFVWPMARVSVLPMFMSFVLASPLCSFCALMFHTMFHTCFIPPCACCVPCMTIDVRCERYTLNDRESQVRSASMWNRFASVPSCVPVCTAACARMRMCACDPV